MRTISHVEKEIIDRICEGQVHISKILAESLSFPTKTKFVSSRPLKTKSLLTHMQHKLNPMTRKVSIISNHYRK
jgi:hypothetical protein